jgi:hypothetical protein
MWSTITTNSLKINVQTAINIQTVDNLECMLRGWKTSILKGLRKTTPITKETWVFSLLSHCKKQVYRFWISK